MIDTKVQSAPLVLDMDSLKKELNIYHKLALVRIEVQKRCTKKSGYNKFADYHYFTLDDILSPTTEELAKQGMVALFNIVYRFYPVGESGAYKEIGELVVTDGTDKITFEIPTADPNIKGASTIQNIGGKNSYIKRYLYMNAMELSEEDDELDATKDKPWMITKGQAKYISDLYKDKLGRLLSGLGLEKIEDMTFEKASEILDKATHPKSNVDWGEELDQEYAQKMKEE